MVLKYKKGMRIFFFYESNLQNYILIVFIHIVINLAKKISYYRLPLLAF